jgi:hypothetical protein
MIPKSGYRFSEKIMPHEQAKRAATAPAQEIQDDALR